MARYASPGIPTPFPRLPASGERSPQQRQNGRSLQVNLCRHSPVNEQEQKVVGEQLMLYRRSYDLPMGMSDIGKTPFGRFGPVSMRSFSSNDNVRLFDVHLKVMELDAQGRTLHWMLCWNKWKRRGKLMFLASSIKCDRTASRWCRHR